MARKKAGRRRRTKTAPRARRAAPAKRKRTKKRKEATTRRKSGKLARPRARQPGPDLLGSPPAEAFLMRDDRERVAAQRLREHTASSPELTGGDVDADWERAAAVGEQAVGGSVATPDQDAVDELGDALGVPRAPDEPFKPSQEILEARDAKRARQEG